MYKCNLCKHSASHPAFLRCQRCYTMRQELRPESRSFAPTPTYQSSDDNSSLLTGMAIYSALSSGSSSDSYSGGGGTFDGGGASSSYDSGSSSSSSDSSSSCSSSDSGSSFSSD
jgi:hypothetical protein